MSTSRTPANAPSWRNQFVRGAATAAAVALVAFGGLTCTDGPTVPSHAGGPALVRFAPTFSRADAAVFDALGTFGITIDNIHIHIDHPPAAPFDTIIAVPAGADSLVLDLPVILNTTTEQLVVQIELRAGSLVLFSGTQTVTATAGAVPSGPPPSIPIVYVGPGAGATQLSIAPRDTAIRVSGRAQFRFTALNASNAPATGVTVHWSASNPAVGSIDDQGVFTPSGVEGGTQILAITANGLRDSTSLLVTAAPSSVVIISGGGQTGSVGSALAQPLVVEVQTAGGNPVPGIAVTFGAPATGGVSPATSVTGLNGRTQTILTLGHTAGAQQFTAASTGLTGATAVDTATAAAATALAKVSGDAQTDSIGGVLPRPFVVKVTDAFGNPVAGATVDWARVAGLGTLATSSSLSDSAGLARIGYALGAAPGTDTISATVHGLPASAVLFTATAADRPATITIVSGNGQATTAGTALGAPLVVRVLDSHGHAVIGQAVTWAVTAGGGTVTPTSSVTDSTGATQAALVVGTVAGPNTAKASVDSVLGVSFSAFGTAGVPATMVKVSGDAQTAAANTALPVKPSVGVSDALGNTVGGVRVTFAVTAGGGSVTGDTTTTNAAGVATVGSWTLGASGTQTLKATSGGLNTTFSATAASPSRVVLVSGGSQTGIVGASLPQPFVVEVQTAGGTVVPGVTVTFAAPATGSVSPTTMVSGPTGRAQTTMTLGHTVGVQSFTASSTGLTSATAADTARAAAAATLTKVFGDAQIDSSGAALPLPFVVKVTDAVGNPVAGAVVAWTVTSGGGTVTPASSTTDSSGATQATLVMGAVAGPNTVKAAVDSVTSVSFSATGTAGAAAAIVKAAGDAQTATANTALPVKPSVSVKDALGNAVSAVRVTFAVTAGGGSATGDTTTTNAAGVATVGSWTLGASGTQNLTATSGSLTTVFTATITGAPSAIVSSRLSAHLDTLTALGDVYTLTAQALDINNAVVAGTFAWISRTPGVATVSNAGVVTAVTNGTTWVVATESGGTKDSSQIVVKQRIATVLVTPGTRNIYLTRNFHFTAAAVDGNNHPVAGALTFTWVSAAPAVAMVDTAGIVTALGLGAAQVSATAGTVTGVTNVSVITPITRIAVGRNVAGAPVADTTSLLSLGATRSFIAVAHDTLDAPITGVTFAWASTNGSVAVLDSLAATTARATSAANGITSITATAQGISGNSPLKVAQQLASIQLTPAADTIAVTGSAQLVARGLDANSRFISGGTFTYASGLPATATVNATTGVVTGVLNGTALITATFVSAAHDTITSNSATVVVGGTVPARISFGRDTLSVGRGSNVSVPIYLSKPNGTAVTVHLTVGDTTAYWTAANVTIPAGQTSANATLNGHNAGTTFVTATDSSGTGFTPDTAALAVQATMKLTNAGYAINATDKVTTQVQLSDPSPAGGTYVTFAFGTPGVATVSPNPAFIPQGQLAADIQITATDSGTTTITPSAIGVNGTPSTFHAYGAWLRFISTALRLGAGQYDNNSLYLSIPTSNNLPVPITLTSSDTTVLTVPATLTIPGGIYYVFLTSTALKPGTATITASALGWTTTNSVVVTVTTPHVAIVGGTSLVTTAPQSNVTVYAEDSVASAHYRTNSLVVHLRSSDSTVMKVLDSVVTIAPGQQANYAARVIPGGLGGTAYIVASASGHTSDSTLYTVAGPKLSLNWTTNRIGAGQEDHNATYVSTPNNVTAPLTITLAVPDTNGIVVPTTVTIPTGTSYAFFNVRAKTTGTDTIIATAPGYQSDSAVYVVTTPRIYIYGGGTLNNFGAAQSIAVYAQDSVGGTHYRSTPLAVTLVSNDTNVVAIDSAVVTIPAGAQYANSPRATPRGTGSAQVVASAPGHFADSVSYTIETPKLNFSFYTYTIGKGQHRNPTDFYVYTPDTRTSQLAVTITQARANVDSLTATYLTIPSASNYSYFTFYGRTQGLDTLIATAPGYLPDSAFIRVTTPELTADNLPSSTTTTNPPIGINVYASDSVSGRHYVTDTVVVHAVSSDSTVIRPAQAYFPIIKNTYYTSTTVNIVGPGTASITYSDSAGTGYLPVTTNTVTVTGPSLAFSSSSMMLGMRQTSGANGIYVYTANAVATPLTVNLASTDARVATVPASVTIPTGSYYAYFPIVGQDTVGTIQIQASAIGYNAKAMTTQVTPPKFAIYTGTNLRTTSPNSAITVYAEDATGTTHFTTEDVVVTLASSSPSVGSIDSTTVTIPSGQQYNTHATWKPGVIGSAQLSATDTRSQLYKYNTGTAAVTVVTPTLSLGWSSQSLGIGQYIDNELAQAQDYLPNGGTVTLAHTGTARTTTVPATTLSIANNLSYAYFRLIGTVAGTDTLTASMASPFHNPATAYTVVGPGRIDPLISWPTSLAVGDSMAVTLYARDPAQTYRNVLAATTWTLAPNANIEFRLGGAVITSVAVPAGAQSVTFYVKALTAGTASATITASNYQSYTNTFTVTP